MKQLIITIAFLTSLIAADAQRRRGGDDTTKKTVVVTSAFKPSLKPAAKINFAAATPAADTVKPQLTYNVPAQNLFFSYQPVSLKPLALSIDSAEEWTNDNYVKLGYGNYKTPYAEAGFTFGDGKKSLVSIHGHHISQQGSRTFQQYSRTGGDAMALYSTNKNIEWRGKIGIESNTQYYYGYQPDTLKFVKDSLRKRYNTFNALVGVRNKEVNSYGITYDPSFSLNLFSDNLKAKETNIVLNAPLTKRFSDAIGFNVGLTADFTNYNVGDSLKVKNNLYYLTPFVTLKKSMFTLNIGLTPTWDNTIFHVLPNFTATIKLKDKPFVLQGGWIGYYQKTTYQSLAGFNPWIAQPLDLPNTRITEIFGGFKGSVTSHFTYNARVSFLRYDNAKLFVNDTIDGKTFLPLFEPRMDVVRIHGEVGYTLQERLSMLAGITFSNYSNLKIYDKPWSLLPTEITGSLRWQVLKELQFKGDLFAWNGAQFRNKDGSVKTMKGAFDLSAGAELNIVPHIGMWLQFNNILSDKYERWNNYEVLGFNIMAGIVFSFSQTRK